MNELEKLKAEHTALGERIAKLEAAEPDYSKWVGRLVEVRNSDITFWRGPYTLDYIDEIDENPFGCAGGDWKQARLYHGTHKLNMIEHDGSSKCPVAEDQRTILKFRSGTGCAAQPLLADWSSVTHYCPVEFCYD